MSSKTAAAGCKNPLDEGRAAALLSGDLLDAGDHVHRAAAVDGADMAEQALEIAAEAHLCVVPGGGCARQGRGGHAAQQVCLQDVVAGEWLAGCVQHGEHAVCPIDPRRGNQHDDMALVEQEVGEPAPLRGLVFGERLDQVLADLQHPGFRRRQLLVVGMDLGGSPPAHVRLEEDLIGPAQFEPPPARSRSARCRWPPARARSAARGRPRRSRARC